MVAPDFRLNEPEPDIILVAQTTVAPLFTSKVPFVVMPAPGVRVTFDLTVVVPEMVTVPVVILLAVPDPELLVRIRLP